MTTKKTDKSLPSWINWKNIKSLMVILGIGAGAGVGGYSAKDTEKVKINHVDRETIEYILELREQDKKTNEEKFEYCHYRDDQTQDEFRSFQSENKEDHAEIMQQLRVIRRDINDIKAQNIIADESSDKIN